MKNTFYTSKNWIGLKKGIALDTIPDIVFRVKFFINKGKAQVKNYLLLALNLLLACFAAIY